MKALRKIAYVLATGLGLGYSSVAPGTAGTLWGVLLAWFINTRTDSVWVQAAIAAVLSLAAIPICDVGEKEIGTKDPHRVVADEYLTFPICMIGLPPTPLMLAVAFVSNRFFDIVKLPPANQLQRLPGGLGITIDDVFAALYSLVFNHAVWLAAGRLGFQL